MEDRDKIRLQEMLDGGMSTSEVAERLGVSPSCVRYNATNLPRHRKRRQPPKNCVTAAVEAYQSHRTLTETAKVLGMSRDRLKRLLGYAGYPEREGRSTWERKREPMRYRIVTKIGFACEGTAVECAAATGITERTFRQRLCSWRRGEYKGWKECEVIR